ncbi:peptide-methionine (S)-S-oxide reductase MsrA [Pseudomonas sp. PDM23]|uniref:peptide-methionine (S)-S-oxide reductase MsrA n=1 Tax=unclassified Pseudomonas TaxID=196821 RepID=UPI00177BFD7F|nr:MULTISPECIES: peptide-methionine (S)-S-oxide reductase MsrA [unclassified Pseudomonas]MBD9579193.1 peptide-methionine (S)-S-oxide reductase MsrA [Pseudomonas sp. PDM23]MBD9672821.1 peptide-methionine (S)-S-oxide reductase MsrA [Pseudomonas sp. PDM21]
MSESQRATFGAGCFWGAEAALRKLDGVIDSRVGYAAEAGREAPLIEVVQVDFAPEVISYAALVEAFWGLHDPTSVDRQGEHVGVKYRSAIFTHSAAQAETADAARAQLDGSGRHRRPITTVVVELGRFELADEEQQRYLEKNGLATCSIGAE